MSRPGIVPIPEFGRGRFTSKNPNHLETGEARRSLNFLHNLGPKTCRRRDALDRIWATRLGSVTAPVLGVAQLDQTSGTIIRFAKIGSQLCTFTLAQTDAPTSIKTGLDATHLPQFAPANNLMFMADWAVKNYVSDGTSGGTNELQKDAPTGAFTLSSAGSAVGNPSGTVKVCYTDYDPTTGTESPPSATSTQARTADQGVRVTDSSLTFPAPYTKKFVYMTKAGGAQMYRVSGQLGSGDFPYTNTTLDSALTAAALSTVHDDVGVAAIEKPEAAKHICWHRGRMFLGNLLGDPSGLRWSKLGEPTQYSNDSIAYRAIGKNDGDEITGLASFRGTLVIFKRQSIWLMNGDDDEQNFTFFAAVTGTGCVASRTIAKDGDRALYFLSACGIYRYDLNLAVDVSDAIQSSDFDEPNLDDLDYVNRRDFFCAGVNPCDRTYELAVTPTGGTVNTDIHVLNLDPGSFGMFAYGMGKLVVSCYSDTSDVGPIRNGAGRPKLYVGTEAGYLYETGSETGADGVTDGTTEATVTGFDVPTGVITCSAAAFRTTGEKLKGLSVTVRREADDSYETLEISTNDATSVTPTTTTWSGDPPAVGDTIYIGAFESTLLLGRFDAGSASLKHWYWLAALLQREPHGTPLRIGYFLDDETEANETKEFLMDEGSRAEMDLGRRVAGLSPYFDIIGVACPLEILLLEVRVEVFEKRMPTR